ncbi:hypothetical protein GVO57_11080 [Sphingomonas changnyeongensis]|uniref:Uncharacterized protein n=1 Tax=Sphingomonas changnyeongensis TaxID=2698679 RepID=A0A7Z2NXI8_9SPHN|nr:hypothetical protein [Sphingomonas changnyeongensis]QHL91254.1 hypothetical protein GVO57_11080 [Sphingomonas changnyeongensis]
MTGAYTHVGKQVLLDGLHFADARGERAAEQIADRMNSMSALIDVLDECAEYLARFSDADDRGPNEAAILEDRVRIAIASAEGRDNG